MPRVTSPSARLARSTSSPRCSAGEHGHDPGADQDHEQRLEVVRRDEHGLRRDHGAEHRPGNGHEHHDDRLAGEASRPAPEHEAPGDTDDERHAEGDAHEGDGVGEGHAEQRGDEPRDGETAEDDEALLDAPHGDALLDRFEGSHVEPVPDAPDGHQVPRPGRIDLDLLPQPPDVHGDRRRVADRVAPHVLEEVLAAERLAVVAIRNASSSSSRAVSATGPATATSRAATSTSTPSGRSSRWDSPTAARRAARSSQHRLHPQR